MTRVQLVGGGRYGHFACPHCGGRHRVDWKGERNYKLPCAFDEQGNYRTDAVLYIALKA